MDSDTIKVIDTILAKGDRVELIPTKTGVKVVKLKRQVVETQNKNIEINARV